MSCDDDGGKIHLSSDDYLIILCWMENPTNFAMIHGSSKKTTVGHKVTKADAFKRLAEHLCEKSETPNLPLISSESMRRRWKTYKDKFVKTLAAKRSETGMGLTEKEMKKGLTVPAKLNKMCPHFSRMEDLFGEKSNITAASTTELGAVRSDEASDELISSDDANVHFGEGSPEFRFDGYTPPPGDSENVNTSNAFDSDRQCTGTPRYTDNCLGLSDDDMVELESIIAGENAATNEKEVPTVAKYSSVEYKQKQPRRKKRKPQPKRAKKKTGPKRDLRPETLSDPSANRSATDKSNNFRSTAQENKVSITMAYVENTKARNGLFKRKLEQDAAVESHKHNRWVMEQEAKQRQQESAQHHELIMVLVKQGKSPAEIQTYLQLSSRAGEIFEGSTLQDSSTSHAREDQRSLDKACNGLTTSKSGRVDEEVLFWEAETDGLDTSPLDGQT